MAGSTTMNFMRKVLGGGAGGPPGPGGRSEGGATYHPEQVARVIMIMS